MEKKLYREGIIRKKTIQEETIQKKTTWGEII